MILASLGEQYKNESPDEMIKALILDWLTSSNCVMDSSWISPSPINLIDCNLVPDVENEKSKSSRSGIDASSWGVASRKYVAGDFADTCCMVSTNCVTRRKSQDLQDSVSRIPATVG